jgi:hypothetical protein
MLKDMGREFTYLRQHRECEWCGHWQCAAQGSHKFKCTGFDVLKHSCNAIANRPQAVVACHVCTNKKLLVACVKRNFLDLAQSRLSFCEQERLSLCQLLSLRQSPPATNGCQMQTRVIFRTATE